MAKNIAANEGKTQNNNYERKEREKRSKKL